MRAAHALVLGWALLCPALLLGQPATPTGRAETARQTAQDPKQLEQRLLSVGRLIEQSSASRQIEASGDAGALERHAKARDSYRQALAARDAGDNTKAARLASESSKLMFEAVRLAAPGLVTEGNWRADFDAHLASVQALLAAQQRISAEKPNTPGALETGRGIEKLIEEARGLATAQQQGQADAVLHQAYLVAKVAVSSMRGGDTLVRSLNFATPEEEYRYELDRNDTHLMLVKVLTAEKSKMTGMDALLKGLVEKAAELRRQAEQEAGGGKHALAVERMEGSTRELVRAIRSLGIFIPG